MTPPTPDAVGVDGVAGHEALAGTALRAGGSCCPASSPHVGSNRMTARCTAATSAGDTRWPVGMSTPARRRDPQRSASDCRATATRSGSSSSTPIRFRRSPRNQTVSGEPPRKFTRHGAGVKATRPESISCQPTGTRKRRPLRRPVNSRRANGRINRPSGVRRATRMIGFIARTSMSGGRASRATMVLTPRPRRSPRRRPRLHRRRRRPAQDRSGPSRDGLPPPRR
jgi:hypothetical protein